MDSWVSLVNTVFMLIVAVREVRRPAKALNWLVLGLILPIIGFVFYLMTLNPVRIPRKRLTSSQNESDTLPDSFSHAASDIAHSLRHLTIMRFLKRGIFVCVIILKEVKMN